MPKKEKEETKNEEIKKGGNASFYILAAVILIIAVGGGYFYSKLGSSPNSAQAAKNTPRGGETRPTLSPALFFGNTAKAYKAAQEIPEVLDGLFCYCYCQEGLGHKSLLTCFTDDHGANCDICINEAIRAGELHKAGYKVSDIKAVIDKEFYRPKQ